MILRGSSSRFDVMKASFRSDVFFATLNLSKEAILIEFNQHGL